MSWLQEHGGSSSRDVGRGVFSDAGVCGHSQTARKTDGLSGLCADDRLAEQMRDFDAALELQKELIQSDGICSTDCNSDELREAL
ncbi:hypothetical protein FVE85_4640 [Porphyridium purpureum]|uniref:Uncharacterized protein n=1 Tax=Porphyridium purpureum TaxID=35688 RepID=A0A5J4YRU0_PORPP|nr:hypothetical protein FVE85_4640 [Porphyridium purpureum]|eukprot:POR9644..scf236_6